MQKITNDLLTLAQNGDETAVAALIARMMPAVPLCAKSTRR